MAAAAVTTIVASV